ncbi:MAG: class I SAM-dependent methyltransferase [Mycobacterium sp.]|nr:class I SAM-dependent methyltransferase [Mycobacterium sp.]
MVRTCDPYGDPRLVALYDRDNLDGPDHDFYRRLATDVSARRILDLGCGTGRLTRSLANADRIVIGIDPSAAMLNVARTAPGADQVTWILADAGGLPGKDAELALMTGNVAQVFIDDAQWTRTLTCLRKALRQGGTLAFESRNPTAHAWLAWTKQNTFRRTDTPHGSLIRWVDNTRECSGTVTYDAHYIFESTDEHLVSHGKLRFRTAREITEDLQRHGFCLQHLYGDWQHCPMTTTSPLMAFVATAR